jgi:hypothetical protein
MSATNVYALGALVVSGSGTFTLKGVEQRQHEPGLDRIEVMAGGQPYPSYVTTAMISPVKKLTVSDISTLLANVNPISGMAFPQTTVLTTVDSFYTALSDGGVRKGATSHMRVRANKGLVVVDSITANQGQKVTAEVTIYTTYDGTNIPFVFTTAVSLPSTPAVSELFTMGPVTINGTLITDVTSVKVDLNPQMKIVASDGDLYPTFAAIMTMSPKITISTNDVAALNTYTLAGTAVNSSGTNVYFRALTNMGTQVASATTSHVKLALSNAQGQVYVGPAGGSNTDHATGSIVIQPIAGSSTILTTTTGVAIT